MFRSALYQLEKFVGELPNAAITGDKDFIASQLDGRVAALETLGVTIRDAWTKQILGNGKEQSLRRYIQYEQAVLTQLSDRLYKNPTEQKSSAEVAPGTGSRDEAILRGLEDLLQFLRDRFQQYFDPNASVTFYHCRNEIARFSAFRKEIFNHRIQDIDPKLISAVNESLKDEFDRGRLASLSYKQLAATERLLTAIGFALENPSTISLATTLYKENLNTPHFAFWYRGYWQSRINKLADEEKKDEYIREEIGCLAVVFIAPDTSFEPLLAPINEQVIPWLQLQFSVDQDKYNAATNYKSEAEQMPLLLSVAQFALFIRVFQKTGCFGLTNAARIMRFFTRHFTTKMQPHISVKSFNHAFYSMDQITAAVVRDLLQKMIDYVNKTYFPK